MGVLNQRDADGELKQPAPDASLSDEGEANVVTEKGLLDATKSAEAEGPLQGMAAAEATESVEGVDDEVGIVGPQRLETPFAGWKKFITLPDMELTAEFTLAETAFTRDSPVSLSLLGGQGACESGTFQVFEQSALQWEVRLAEATIADLMVRDGNLQFQWRGGELPEQAAYFANTVLVFEHFDEQHAMALREHERMPAIEVELERRKPYEFRISQLPHTDVMLEFVSDPASLAVALPRAIIDVSDKMQIGLDAGPKSLFVLTVQPKFRDRKQSLLIRATARMNLRQKRNPIRAGWGAGLRNKSVALAQSIFRMKALAEQADGDAEDRMERQIEIWERQKKQMDAVVESYLAAEQSSLHLKIYRQVGRFQVPLLEFGGRPDQGE